MQTVMDLVHDYLKAAEIDIEQVVDYRFTKRPRGFGDLFWQGEVDVDNGDVKYTRVYRMWYDDKGWFRTKSIFMKTRLHVPAKEVPEGATVYSAKDGSGPYMIFPSGERDLYAIADEDGIRFMLGPDEMVSVEFYYARGEGSCAGGVIFGKEEDLVEWCRQYYEEDSPNRLVDGCKFDLWSLSHALYWREPSVFDLPPTGLPAIEIVRKQVTMMVEFTRGLGVELADGTTWWSGPFPNSPRVYDPAIWEERNEPIRVLWERLISELEAGGWPEKAKAARELPVADGLLTAAEFEDRT